MHMSLKRIEEVDKIMAALALLIERRNAINKRIALLEALEGFSAADCRQNIYRQ